MAEAHGVRGFPSSVGVTMCMIVYQANLNMTMFHLARKVLRVVLCLRLGSKYVIINE